MDNPAKLPGMTRRTAEPADAADAPLPSWVVGLCAVGAFASLSFSALLFLNR
jgi:hypothetical protein